MTNQILNKVFILSCYLFLIVSCTESDKSNSLIIDNDQIFDSNEELELNSLLDSVNKSKRYNILIHTIKKGNSRSSFETITDSVFNNYTFDKPFYLLSVSKSFRNVSFTFDKNDSDEISYEKTDSIIANYMIPSLKDGDYKKACENAILSLDNIIN